ncbi:MAG: helicase HerA domain-containing protein [Lachnotalea sp.]
MLKEFYDFIANRVNIYFQNLSDKHLLPKGESYCLKLDDEKMVSEVNDALKKTAYNSSIIGDYKYNGVYETFTLKLKNDEIVIAAQCNGMTSDFLGATLRNAANEANLAILMISANPIDSALSGTRDMAASGMPFHANSLIAEITAMINNSDQLTELEKYILQFELERREEDVFSDKSSLFEYKELLAIMGSGAIRKGDFTGFRLFSVDGKCDYSNSSKNQIYRELKENHALFEKVDRSVRFGNVENDLNADFEDKFLGTIEKSKNKDLENWSAGFSYQQMQTAMDKKQSSKANPLLIENSNISAYYQMPFNSYMENETLFIRNDSSMTGKKRAKSIIVFDKDKNGTVSLHVECNVKILQSNILADDANVIREGKDLTFEFNQSGIHFHKIELKDEENSITYVFKVCILDISANYLIPTIKTSYSIDYKANKKNCRIRLLGVGIDLTFNTTGDDLTSVKLEDANLYSCTYNDRLHIYSSEEELSNFGNGIKIDVNFAGTVVPFTLYPDEVKNSEIIGRKILKKKLAKKSGFTFVDSKQIYRGTQEYFAKENLLKELKLEQKIVDEQILCGECVYFDNINQMRLSSVDLKIPSQLESSYLTLLEKYREEQTIPTLAFITDEFIILIKLYLEAFWNCFENLNEMDSLTVEQENVLRLGTIYVNDGEKELLLTPLHPINMAYQLMLVNEEGMDKAADVVIDRLHSLNLLPYIKVGKKTFKVSEQMYSMEWKHYAPVENKRYMGSRKYVPKLVEEKITEFIAHFKYIFEDIGNREIIINLVNMGDCSEVLQGIAQYFIKALNKNADIEKLTKFQMHIYTSDSKNNAFSNIKEYSRLKKYLREMKLSISAGTAMSDLEGIISKKVSCYFHQDDNNCYEYSHITFYEMESEVNAEYAAMNQIDTGVSLSGILSGISSGKYGQKYRTGYGSKYSKNNELISLAEKYNALVRVGTSGNPYQSGIGISTQIDTIADEKMEHIYDCSNWVVFVDPKVDLDFFCEKEATSDLLIIHYSDQYTSSSGYDAITVTHKSKQYAEVIKEFLKEKGVAAGLEDVHNIINLFNAINGDWLLRLVSSKKNVGNQDSTFSREKISIVAAIKFMLAYLKHEDMLWVPISMEEMLRVSGSAGLAQSESVLSAKNLGFDKGATCDDLLMIGLRVKDDKPVVYLYPTEVKTGNNDSSVIKKALEQASKTAEGFEKALTPTDGNFTNISTKVNRNFMMQLVVTSCKKMQVYHVDDSQDWNIVLDRFREALLNEDYEISTDIREVLGKGAVLSFKKDVVTRKSSYKGDVINFIEMPEKDEYALILKDAVSIAEIVKAEDPEFIKFAGVELSNITGDLTGLNPTLIDMEDLSGSNDGITSDGQIPVDSTSINEETEKVDVEEEENESEKFFDDGLGIKVDFGTNLQDGKELVWRPNNTDAVFHTNTGIIGTMGTGKTQFTQSLIAQIYRDKGKNVASDDIGILIFDYKGDYNENKKDFMIATDAKIYKPYHLPFNPLTLSWSGLPKPLLPVHTANTFVDTLAKVYPSLGPKQKSILLNCIDSAYGMCSIRKADQSTWKNEPPTFSNVYQIYDNDEEIKKGDVLDAALQKIAMFEIFEPIASKTQSLFDLLHGVVVIDLSGYDSDIQNLVVAITLDLFYSQMQAAGHSKLNGNLRQLNKVVLVDEADNFLREGYPSLRKILKEGREFGVGTILSTQFLKHFITKEEDYSKYILTWIVHNVADLNPADVRFVFNSQTGSTQETQLCSNIRNLKKHESIVKMGNSEAPIYIRDKAFWEYFNDQKSNFT